VTDEPSRLSGDAPAEFDDPVEHANDPRTRQEGRADDDGAESVAIVRADPVPVKVPGS
jgi:hypothetical protein